MNRHEAGCMRFYSLLLLTLLATLFLVGCGGGGGGTGSAGSISPAALNWVIPKADLNNSVALPTGEKVSSTLISISFKSAVSRKSIESIIGATGGVIEGEIPDLGFYVKFSVPKTGVEIRNIVDNLRINPGVESAAPVFYYARNGSIPLTDIETNGLLSDQEKWGFTKIRMKQAWDTIRDSNITLSQAVVAVIDTGIDIDHQDLKPNIILENNNVKAWDFGDNDGDVSTDFYSNTNINDAGHGTAVSGVIAATTNGYGINGVAPTVKIFPLKCFSSLWGEAFPFDEQIQGYSVALAIIWAKKAGVDVINLSLGHYVSKTDFEQTFEYKAINLALSSNIVVVASAGNKGQSSDTHFPSAMPGVISVGATDSADNRSTWGVGQESNYSDDPNSLWVAAPGTAIYTTVDLNILSITDPAYWTGYGYKNGTSLAAPFVSGLVALLRELDKNISNAQIASIIRSSSDNVNVTYPNDSQTHIWRRINAENAVKFLIGVPGVPPAVQTLAATSSTSTGATLNGNVNPNGLPTNYWFEYGISPTLGTYSSTPTKSAGSGTTIQSFSEPISGLLAGTPYYFRIAASNSGGTARGIIDSFSTGSGTSTKWTKTFGFGSNDDYGTSVQQTFDGGFIVAGVTSSWGPGDDNACLIKTDSSGNALWAKTYGEVISNDTANAVQQTSDGGFIFAGTTWSNLIAGGHNVYLVKTDLDGNTVWIKTYDGPDGYNDDAYSVRQTSDGGFIIAGGTTIYTGAPDYINLDYLLIKTDANGNIIWSKSYGGSRDDIAKSVQQTLDGGYIIVGTSASFGGAYLVKTDTNGNMVWLKAYDLYADGTSGVSVHQTSDGGYIVAGTAGYGNAGGYNYADVLLVKTDGSGNVLWSKRHRNNGGGNLYVTGAQPTLDGGYIISGYLESFTTNVFLMKTDSNGDVIWLKTFGVGFGYSVQQTLDGGYIIVGGAAYDVYLIKTDSNGNTQ